MQTQLESFFKPLWKQIIVSFLVVIYIAINIFRVGGDSFVINLNNFIVTPLALAVTFLAYGLLRQIKSGTQNQLLWLGITIGWALWTTAELWWFITSLIGQEVPYPSWADFFWLVGYLPIIYALEKRIRSLPKTANSEWQVRISWGIAASITAFAILFIIIPIIRANDPSAILESIINVLYPLADTILLIAVLWLWFSFQQGMYGRVWKWITVGFTFMSLADLGFAYAITANLYYPEQQVNLLRVCMQNRK